MLVLNHTPMKKQIITEIIAALLIVLFVYAGASKLLNIDKFYFEINNQPFPNKLTPYIMAIIIAGEFGLSILLMIPQTRRAGLIGSLATMIVFTIYVSLVLLKLFSYIPCSCGGFISQLGWEQHLLFNLFFVITSSIAIKLYRSDNGNKPEFKKIQSE